MSQSQHPSEAPNVHDAQHELPDPQTLVERHPADVAEVIEALPVESAAEVLDTLPPEAAAHALEYLDEGDAGQVVEDMDPARAAAAIAHMSLDDATDLLGRMDPEQRAGILGKLSDDDRNILQALLTYNPESAAGIMSPEVTALPADMSVSDAIAELRRVAHEKEQIYYTYVVDSGRRLLGVLSLRDLILARGEQKLHDIMIRSVVKVPGEMDREEVARLLSKYGYYALPVVDPWDRLLGIVTVDDVVDVIREEATEDVQRMVGAGADERIDSPVGFTLSRRVPWLMVNLGTAFLAASVVGLFEATLERITALAVLMPVVAGQAGNTGAQSMAVVIRGIATGEARLRSMIAILARELCVGVLAGLAIAAAASAAILGWWHDARLALVLGLAMVTCLAIAAVSGALVPLLMKRLGFDPAQSSSIILTTITDVSGLGVFLLLGTWLLLPRAGA